MSTSGHHGEQERDVDFSVTLAASARVNLRDRVTAETAPHLIHAVAVSQPAGGWTVLRDHADFLAMDAALRGEIAGLPGHGLVDAAGPGVVDAGGVEAVVRGRNAAQEWLSAVLTVPDVRESPVMRQFLCYGANVVPAQFEGLAWVDFTAGGGARALVTAPQPQAAGTGTAGPNLDEMEMEDMFALDDDPGHGHGHDHKDHDDGDSFASEDDAEYLQGRHAPTAEPLTQSEIMEIQQDYEQVEMVEDVGSLAQSMGASHLGRSLNLQKQMLSSAPFPGGDAPAPPPPNAMPGGLAIAAGTAVAPGSHPATASPGGIGGAVAKADTFASPPSTQAHVAGLADCFHRTAPVSIPSLDSFEMIKVIGKGSFGKVFLAREKRTSEMFALKVLKKDNIIKRNQVEHTRTERSVLGYVKHPFIVGLKMAFQSRDKLYFVLDYCAGGELFFHLGKVGKFSEPRACFYAAEITLAINYVHDLDIVYRDLKPENVLLDSRGHVRLTDFGLSKEGISNSSSGATSFCGTPEYLAPEILNRQGHGRAVDWWSLGALLYEMLTGLPPFYCRDREKLFEKIRRGTLDYPDYLSPRAKLLLRGLLTKDPQRRLGSGPNDSNDIKAQEFFSDLSWDKLMAGEMAPPWDPQIKGSLDMSQFDHEFTNMPLHSPGAFQGSGLGATSADNTFEGFTFTDRSFYHPPYNAPSSSKV